MKKFLLIIVLSAIFVSASSLLYGASGKNTTDIVTREHFEGREISRITASSAFDIELVKSDQMKVILEVNSDIEHRVRMSCENGSLNIGLESVNKMKLRDILNNKTGKLRVTVYTPSVESVKLSGATTLRSSDTFVCENIDFNISGASNVNMTVEADNTAIKISGASDIVLKGSTDNVKATVSGASDVNLSKFNARNADVSVSGASDVDIFASESIAINASGASGVKYTGGAKTVKSKVSGASKIKNY